MIISLVVLISGNGSNLQAIINYFHQKIINGKFYYIKAVISNRKYAYGLIRAESNNIPIFYSAFIKSKITRSKYDRDLKDLVLNLDADLVVCAGWMHILSKEFLNGMENIINLHPALWGEFPGNNSIEDAYNAFKKGKVDHTGIMVHYVIPEIDAGKIIYQKEIPIFKTDGLNDLKFRIGYHEKNILIQAIMTSTNNSREHQHFKTGKVRDLYTYDDDKYIISHSDRVSSFDRAICDIEGKGNLLCLLSDWWFQRTRHIVPNHVIKRVNNYLVVKKCSVIPIEFVVRGYITGNSATSLWTHYNKGVRIYCGETFPDGLRKNQRLEEPLLTPTTKDEHDELISCQEIVDQNILNQPDLDYIKQKSLELFRYGQEVADRQGLILVDTKYEFGRDQDGNILLIDEVHTCDSSRYWVKSSYNVLFNDRKEPQKLDKDSVRDYVKSVCDPYDLTKPIPEIPQEQKDRVYQCYRDLYVQLTGLSAPSRLVMGEFDFRERDIVIIVSGSTSDRDHVIKIEKELDNFHIDYHSFSCSAHKETQRLLNIMGELKACPKRKIFVTVAGRSNALSGVVACNCDYPVIACPPFKDKTDMIVNINSSLQCPSKTPVMTILEPNNVAITCNRIFNL
jgi:formyltetrahydrofolate-dependent phosphoribosylglycinamide formyltransferase/phosphoribosylaminoimidazole-succinocarboxamide synthase